MTRWIVSATLIALTLIVALLSLADTSDAARPLPTSTSAYVSALRGPVIASEVPIDSPSVPPSVRPSGPMPTRTPGPTVAHSVGTPVRWFRGQATHWNSLGGGIYVATNPDLHIRMGSVIQVCDAHARGCVPARVVTTCACLGPNSGRIIDLSNDLFIHFAALSRGVVQVVLEVTG